MHDGNNQGRERLSMDVGWRFHLGDVPFPTPVTHQETYNWGWAKSGTFQGAAHPKYDDSAWRALDLPHDWAVEGTFSPDANMDHGFLPTGVAWYRKIFLVPAEDEGKRLWLEFDGVFRAATVFLNGHHIGHEPSGYITFRYDITDQVLYGDMNTIAVRVDARESEGWWYEGAGIYRHTWLVKTAPLHVLHGVCLCPVSLKRTPAGLWGRPRYISARRLPTKRRMIQTAEW